MSHINAIGQKEGRERDRKLKELLVKSFPVVKVKALRPIVMCILRNTPQIDDQYLKILVRDRELYNDTDTEVKRQIWKDNQSLFGDEVSPLLSQYISEKENILFDHQNINTQFFGPSPKVGASVRFPFNFYPTVLSILGETSRRSRTKISSYDRK